MSGSAHSISSATSTPVAVIAIALSAGGLKPLRTIVRGLPSDFPAAVVIAQHVGTVSLLPQLLSYDTPMRVTFARRDMSLCRGHVYVCPAAQHISVNPDATLSVSSREHLMFSRPSGNWLFESVAASFRERSLAVVLSGSQRDGAIGTKAVRAAGGVVIVQNPRTCDYPDMPRAAMAMGTVDHVLAPEQIAPMINAVLAPLDVARCVAAWEQPFSVLDG